MPTHVNHFIGPGESASASGDALPLIDPATGAQRGTVADASPDDVDRAVREAQRAFPAWSALAPEARSRALLRLADLIERDNEPLARAESLDTGKPIALARAVDIPRSASNFRFFATAILHGSSAMVETASPAPSPGSSAARAINYTLRKPRGVAGLISPWNLPLYLLTWKIAPAIATGNTCVCKPSELTPTTATMVARLALEAGIPPGVVNVVHGRGSVAGAALVKHEGVPAISFTGSTAVGQWIGREGGGMLKRLSLELGGKNAFVVFDDADVPSAIETAARAAFSNQGQICLCGSRLLVQRRVFDRVLAGVAEIARGLVPGDPQQDSTRFGALVSEAHLAKVAGMVDEARAAGATIVCGGARARGDQLPDRCRGGAFYPPTVVTGLDHACRVVQEEIFGPVVTVHPFDEEEEAIALANGTRYGLAATVFTRDLARAHRVASRMEAGIVWVNCWMVRDLRTPFGGVKQSGVGREGGDEALRFFTEPTNVCVAV